MKVTDIITEAANPAQQAAIAIAMKKAGKKPKQGVAEGSLNELSKDTLKSYAKKAVPDMQASQKKSEIEAGKAASTKDDETAKTHYDAAKQAKDRTEKRMAGISGAIKRVTKQGMAEGKPQEKEADYGDDYQDMVARVKKLAGMGPLKTVYDPQKRVYRNVPTAVQPPKK